MKVFFKKAAKTIKQNFNILDIAAIFIISVCFGLSDDLIKNNPLVPSYNLVLKFLGFFILFFILTFLLRIALNKICNFKKPNKITGKFTNKIINHKKRLLIIAAIIFVCWLPFLAMLYPGTCINDTWYQLISVIKLKNGIWDMNAHHPILDTFFMSAIILPVVYKSGSWHLAIFIYVLIQAVITSLVFSYSVIYTKEKLKLNNRCVLLLFLIYVLCPIYVASVQTVSKDALSAWIYVLFSIQYIEIVRTKGEFLKNKKNIIIHIITIVFCILTKKAEAYIIIFSYISLLIIYRKKFKKFLIPFATAALIPFIILPVFNLTFGIKKSGKQEMYSLPFQMTARYVKYNSENVTQEEKEVISKVLDYEKLGELYNPTNADPIKKYTQKGKDKDYTAYLKVWFDQGFKNPKIYIKALACHTAGWFSTTEYKPLINMDHHTSIDKKNIPEYAAIRNGITYKTYTVFNKTYDFLYSIPVLKIFLSYGFYASFLPMFIILTLIKNKKYKALICCIPSALSIVIGCYLAPVSVNLEGLRYLFPITYTLPILLMVTIYSLKNKNEFKTEF